MNEACITILKGHVPDADIVAMENAFKAKDTKAWDLARAKAIDEAKTTKRQSIMDATITQDLTDYIKIQTDLRDAWNAAHPGKMAQIGGKFGIGGKGVAENRGASISQALVDIISGAGARQGSGVVPLDKYIEGVRGQYMARMVEAIHKTRPIMLGLRRAGQSEFTDNLVKTIFGSKSAKVSKEMQNLADAWKGTTKALMERFNKAGGSITELMDFNIPVNHDSSKVAKFTENEWVEDADRLFDLRLPEGANDKATKDTILRNIYKSISTEGAVPMDSASTAARGIKLGDSHQQFRYLNAKTGDTWLEYTKKYGRHSQPIDGMVDYIDQMTRSIALMETLGSNPSRNFKTVVDAFRQAPGGTGKIGRLALASLDQIVAETPGYESALGDALRGMRNFETAAKLGSASITAMTDVPFSFITAAYNGMNPFNVMRRHITTLFGDVGNNQKKAGELGLLMEYALDRAVAVNRMNETDGYGALNKMADFSTRASGLNHWTNSGRTAFGLEFLSNMGDLATSGKPMTGGMKKAFERYGLTADDWDIVSKYVTDGYIDVTKMGVDNDRLAGKVVGMIREETDLAIPTPNAKARAITQGGVRRNTVANEMIRTATQFKSFGVSMMMSHLGRISNDTTDIASRAGYTSSLVLGAGMTGMAVLQLKELSKGRSMRDWDAQLMKDGMMQGGVFGIIGDAMFNDPALFGGLPAWALGPSFSDLDKMRTFLMDISDREKAIKFGSEWYLDMAKQGGVTMAEEATAFATRLWYTRVAWERTIMVNADQWADPDHHKKQRRSDKWLQERGQEVKGDRNWVR